MTSLVLICATADRTTVNLLGKALGVGDNNLSVALSTNGSIPATHYAGNAANGSVSPRTEWVIKEFQQGRYPGDLALPAGMTVEQVLEFLPRLIFRFNEPWEAVLAELGLYVVSNELV